MSSLTGDEVLLHVCCGPDATVPWPDLQLEGLKVTGYFYGCNIHPLSEYDLRLGAVRSVSVEWGGDLIVPPYDPDIWYAGLENSPTSLREGLGVSCAFAFSWRPQQRWPWLEVSAL